MRARPDVGAIVHTHSLYATVLGCARKDIPACPLHDRGVRAGRTIRCSRYATYGTAELSDRGAGGARGPQLLHPRQSRHDRDRPEPCQGEVAGGRARDHRQAILPHLVHRRPGAAAATPRSPTCKERFKSYGPRPKVAAANENRTRRPRKRRRRAERGLPMEPFDLLVVGGGINGAGIARDAAGRGLKVLLCEQDDLAQGTSSRSGKLVHGGLRYLEYYEFRLVREALIEREVLLRAAPHIIWPMRFVLPHVPEQRPAWLVRLGLFLYDHLGGRKLLPARARSTCGATRGPAAQARIPQGVRVFRLLGRRCAAGRAQRARCRRARRRDPDPHGTARAPAATAGDAGRPSWRTGATAARRRRAAQGHRQRRRALGRAGARRRARHRTAAGGCGWSRAAISSPANSGTAAKPICCRTPTSG